MRNDDARRLLTIALAATFLATAGRAEDAAGDAPAQEGPAIASMSALAFTPDGVLLVGDGVGGAIYSIELEPREARGSSDPVRVPDVETKIAALLGARSSDVLVHDLAVDPISQASYLAVSRNRGRLAHDWAMPNDVGPATELVRIDPSGALTAVDLSGRKWARAALPNPADPATDHAWKEGVKQRVDTIVKLAWDDGAVWVAGLSNQEFASTLWKVPFPFDGSVAATSVEIFHGAHGQWETFSPVRAMVPYELGGKKKLLAAYLCTPLVTFDSADLEDGAHVRGRTVAEFGSGNFPLDMVVMRKEGRDVLVLANSQLPILVIDPADIERFEGAITEEVPGYLGGVSAEYRAGTGTVQMDRLNDQNLVLLRRNASGTMDLASFPVRRL